MVEDGVNGLLIENENAVDLEQKLEKLIVDKDLRGKMGEESHRIIKEKFSAKVWGDSFLELVGDIAEK